MERIMGMSRRIEASHPPAAIPPQRAAASAPDSAGAGEWQALYPAWVSAIVGKLLAGRPGAPAFEVNPALLPFSELLAYQTTR
jgi:hypothetical protein